MATKEEIIEKLRTASTAEELDQVKALIDELKVAMQQSAPATGQPTAPETKPTTGGQ